MPKDYTNDLSEIGSTTGGMRTTDLPDASHMAATVPAQTGEGSYKKELAPINAHNTRPQSDAKLRVDNIHFELLEPDLRVSNRLRFHSQIAYQLYRNYSAASDPLARSSFSTTATTAPQAPHS